MDPSPALETVYQAVYSLFNNPNTAEKEKASQWLGQLQKSFEAWKVADDMLREKRDLESCYFAAQTMRTKIQLSFHELPNSTHLPLRDSLLEHITQINENTNKAIVIQLCLALADLALQMVTWQNPVMDLINKFSSNSSTLWPLLEILKVLPEEVTSHALRLGENRREQVRLELANVGPTVAGFLQACLKNSVNNPRICNRILSCFTSWISIQAISFETVQSNEVIAFAFEVLKNHTENSSMHEKATDCVCMILKISDDDMDMREEIHKDAELSIETQMKQMHVYMAIMALEQPYHLSVALEDIEKSTNYCRIFTELAETFLDTMISRSTLTETHYSIKVLDLVLTCVGHHDYEVAQITFHLWYRLSETLYQQNNDELNVIFKPHIERLIATLCRHCQMEPDHLGLVDEASGDHDFADFRNKVYELIKDVVFVIGSSHCFRQMFSNLTAQGQPCQPPSWDAIESALFVMQSVAKNILPEENDVVPKVVDAILKLPENTHVAVKHTSVLLLGELCEWIDKHPHTLEPILNFLLKSLSQPSLGNASLVALQNICSACSEHMKSHFSGLLQIACSLDSFAINNTAAISLLKGVSSILVMLPADEIERAMKELCWFQARPLQALMENAAGVHHDGSTKNNPIVYLDRLAAIFRHTTAKMDDSAPSHPYQAAVNEMWPILSNVCSTYQQDPKIMEHACRCLRFAIRCSEKYSENLLKPLVEQMVQLYSAHQHSCFLYLGSILVDAYGHRAENVPGLLGMLEAFLGPTFQILQEVDGLKNHPDTVDDLLRLCYRLLQQAPVPFLHSPLMANIIECALMACGFEHKDANISTMKFFLDLVNCNEKSMKNKPEYAIRRQLVHRIVEEKGQAMVTAFLHAAIFTMSTYCLPDIAAVLLHIASVNKEHFSKWMEEAIKSISQNSVCTVTVSPDQLEDFHITMTRTDNPKTVKAALRNFARLYC